MSSRLPRVESGMGFRGSPVQIRPSRLCKSEGPASDSGAGPSSYSRCPQCGCWRVSLKASDREIAGSHALFTRWRSRTSPRPTALVDCSDRTNVWGRDHTSEVIAGAGLAFRQPGSLPSWKWAGDLPVRKARSVSLARMRSRHGREWHSLSHRPRLCVTAPDTRRLERHAEFAAPATDLHRLCGSGVRWEKHLVRGCSPDRRNPREPRTPEPVRADTGPR